MTVIIQSPPIIPKIKLFSVIGVDEGQFFMDVVEFADQAANRRKVVLVAALDGTFDRKKFNRILELIPLAEHVTKLNAVCKPKIHGVGNPIGPRIPDLNKEFRC